MTFLGFVPNLPATTDVRSPKDRGDGTLGTLNVALANTILNSNTTAGPDANGAIGGTAINGAGETKLVGRHSLSI